MSNKKMIVYATTLIHKNLQDKFDDLENMFKNRNSAVMDEITVFYNDYLKNYTPYEEFLEFFDNKFVKIKEKGTVLDEGYVPWIEGIKDKVKWSYWNHYKSLLASKGWSKSIIDSIDEESDKILDRTFNPMRKDIRINKRGLVIGRVQSGKTANYMGVVSKALDTGFKVIIILTGVHENLRRQTFKRIQEEIGTEGIHYHTSDETDFKSMHARIANDIENSNDKHLFIVKKNSSVLKNLIRYFKSNKKNEEYIARTIVVDDEADNASINTKHEEEPTTTNKSIRELLNCFLAKAYIGYTATPYANVFIDKDLKHKTLQDDIFPKDFIITLPISEDYCGAKNFFPKDGEKNRLFNIYDDNATLVIYDSIKKFILSTAIRKSRGIINDHNTMLVHDSFRIGDHLDLSEGIESMVENLKGRIYNPKDSLIVELKKLFDDEYVETSILYNRYDDWAKIEKHIPSVLNDIEVVMVNSMGQELEYFDEDIKTYIAVGGNKLSRGLTLEGLTISVFARNSKQYDTLMQMGRWFGYRASYLDLCRIVLPEDIYKNFVEINNADKELYSDIKLLNEQEGMTPKDFALKVRSSYGLLPTSKSKMGKSLHFAGLSGKTRATLRFGVKDNIEVTEQFLENQGGLENFIEMSNSFIKLNTSVEDIIKFISQFKTHDDESNFDKNLILPYLNKFHIKENCNIVVVNQKGDTTKVNIAGKTFYPAKRTVVKPWRVKRLLAPSIEIMDLDYMNKNNGAYLNEKEVLSNPDEDSISFKKFKNKYRKRLTFYIIFTQLEYVKEGEKSTRLVTGIGMSFKSINREISDYYYNM
jgi:hypothetical protein